MATLIRHQRTATQKTTPPDADETTTGVNGQKDTLRRGSENACRARVVQFATDVISAGIEVLHGTRKIDQLRAVVAGGPLQALALRSRLAGRRTTGTRHPTPEHIAVVHLHYLRPGIYEIAVVTQYDNQFRANTVRVERRHGAWFAAALHIG